MYVKEICSNRGRHTKKASETYIIARSCVLKYLWLFTVLSSSRRAIAAFNLVLASRLVPLNHATPDFYSFRHQLCQLSMPQKIFARRRLKLLLFKIYHSSLFKFVSYGGERRNMALRHRWMCQDRKYFRDFSSSWDICLKTFKRNLLDTMNRAHERVHSMHNRQANAG